MTETPKDLETATIILPLPPNWTESQIKDFTQSWEHRVMRGKDLTIMHSLPQVRSEEAVNKGREAFEAYVSAEYGWNDFRQGGPGYHNDEIDVEYKLWQAARNHYASKLTEKDAARIIWDACGSMEAEHDGEYAVIALKAAGVRFKEEA